MSQKDQLERIANAAEGILDLLARKYDDTNHVWEKNVSADTFQCRRCSLTVKNQDVGNAFTCGRG